MLDHPNAQLVWRAADAFQRGDLATFATCYADEAVWHVPGEGPLSGEYRGTESILALFARAYGLSGGTLRVEPLDVMASESHAVLWQHVSGVRDGRTLEVDEALVFRIVDDRIAEVWERTDQYAMDDFFSVGEVPRRREALARERAAAHPVAAISIVEGEAVRER
jgi:ketosteroid isomerase-like protein